MEGSSGFLKKWSRFIMKDKRWYSDILDVPVSRRTALQGFGLGGLALPLAQAPFRTEGRVEIEKPLRTRVTVPRPSFSQSERNRRWAAIRLIMERPQWKLDALVTLADAAPSHTRYLTQIGGRFGGADVVFPRDASRPVRAFVGSSQGKGYWEKRMVPWISDGKLVLGSGEGSRAIIDGFKSSGLDKPGTRIGLAKLTGTRHRPEGLVPAAYLENLKAALPGVFFLPIERWGADAGPIDEPAMVKSAEEQGLIRQSVAAGEKAIETLIGAVRAGVKQQADVWFPTFVTLFLETAEEPINISISLDAQANATSGAPTEDSLEPGQIISEEIGATVQGYRGQINHSIFVGGPSTPGYPYYRTTMEVAVKLFFDAIEFIRPGATTTGEVVKRYAEMAEKFGGEDRGGVVFHTGGIDKLQRPRLGPRDFGSGRDDNVVIVPGMVFDFKPAIRMKRSVLEDVRRENRTVQIGEHVLVTERGAVRLGKRPLKPLATEG